MGSPINPKYPLFLKDIDKDTSGFSTVVVEDNFNIDAKPGVFYDIKNEIYEDINVNLIEEENKNIHIIKFNSPANISFNKEIKWFNDVTPDLLSYGQMTFFIIDDVTYVNYNYGVTNIPNNEIWYTSVDKQIIIPDVIGLDINVISNTYDNNKGIIVLDKDLTRIEDNGIYWFAKSETLESIILPNSVKYIGDQAFESCPNLTSIYLGDKLEYLGTNCFCRTKLNKLSVPNTIKNFSPELLSDQNLTHINYIGTIEQFYDSYLNYYISNQMVKPIIICKDGVLRYIDYYAKYN